jgi:hypothetical protein
MKKLLMFYSDDVRVQVLAVAIPYVGYVIGWFARSLELVGWSFYVMCVTVAAILAAAVRHRLVKNGKKARSSLDAFCITFLLVFLTVLILSPLSFRR